MADREKGKIGGRIEAKAGKPKRIIREEASLGKRLKGYRGMGREH